MKLSLRIATFMRALCGLKGIHGYSVGTIGNDGAFATNSHILVVYSHGPTPRVDGEELDDRGLMTAMCRADIYGEDVDLSDVPRTGKRGTGKVLNVTLLRLAGIDPVYLKAVAEAAIAADVQTMFLCVPKGRQVSDSDPVYFKSKDDAGPSLLVVLMPKGHNGECTVDEHGKVRPK